MKKLRFILMACGLLLTLMASGQTLTFRLANPNIVFSSGVNYFAFDIQVKASAGGSYLFSGQAVLPFANANLSNGTDWSVVNGPLLAGTFGIGNTKYNACVITLTGSPLKANIAWTSNPASVGEPASSARFNEITTTFQTLVTVYAPITNNTGTAGIDFDETSMNGQQFYKTGAAPWFAAYTSPSLYEAADFMTTYLGRIYANAAWSQFGGVADWTVNLNTSVWNGNASVAGGVDAKASNLRLHGTATLTLPVNGKLTVSGTTEVTTVEGLSFLSDATGTGSFITNAMTGGGTARAQRYVIGSSTAWHLISAPVGGQSIPDFVNAVENNVAFSGGKFGLAPYDNTIPGWAHFTSTTLAGAGNFVPGKGYEILRNDNGTLLFSGTIATGTIPINISNTGVNLWWNLVGNPYPSAVNANIGAGATNFLTANAANLDAQKTAVYIWNQPNGTYDVYNQASPAAYVPIGQGFFVKAVSGTNPVNFTAGMRAHASQGFKAGQSEYPSIKVNANIAGNNRNAQVYYVNGATAGVDQGYDAGMFEDSPVYGVSTRIEGSEIGYAIQSLPETSFENVIGLVLNAPAGSAVNFSVDVADLPGNTKIYLEDKLTGKFTRLDENGSFYNVTVNSGSNDRFFIHVTQGTLGVAEEVMGEVTAIPMPREHQIRILGTTTPNAMATIYELNGAVVGTQVLPNVGENMMPFMPVANGVYLLKVQQTGEKAPTSVKINWIY